MTPKDWLLDEYSHRGSTPGVYIMELARFHQMPVLSVKDALYPSLTRFVNTHLTTNRYPFASKYSVVIKILL